jgi:hypothetical protein
VSADSEKQVLDYLDRVADEAQRRIRHPTDRIRLVEELRDRIDKATARKGDQPKAVRKILADLGSAEQQVDEFLVRRSATGGSGVPSPRPRPEARPAPPRTEVRARTEASPRTEPVTRPESGTRSAPSAPEGAGTAPPQTAPGGISTEAETAPIEGVGAAPAARRGRFTGGRAGTIGDLSPAASVAVVLLAVAAITLLLGWIGWLICAVVALKLPPAARGVRVIALVSIPAVGLPVFLLLGLGTDVDEVMTRIYPFVVGVLGAAFLMWGAFRYRPPQERQPVQRPPRRPQRRLVRGFSRHGRG